MDEWRDVKGYEGLYRVSNTGSVNKILPNGKRKRIRAVQGSGMRRVMLRGKGENELVQIAVLMLEAFDIPRPAGYKATCKDGNYDNLKLANLQWVVRRQEKYYQRNRAHEPRRKYTEEELAKHSPLWKYFYGKRTCTKCARYGECVWRKESDVLDYAAEGCRGWQKRITADDF